ncbi:unnamed protein product [Didymodactylos carnosus]|uniref:Uncharacterized protein n=1 Tax=Didymodactylos carnosus TaxID=1234261 RepID=A0A815BAQ8_9BILA|nr:unnamed protein product [Didymodactylos carnosus]CAF4052316.1 unnamed protein product [Didymodactylos carnosus]
MLQAQFCDTALVITHPKVKDIIDIFTKPTKNRIIADLQQLCCLENDDDNLFSVKTGIKIKIERLLRDLRSIKQQKMTEKHEVIDEDLTTCLTVLSEQYCAIVKSFQKPFLLSLINNISQNLKQTPNH